MGDAADMALEMEISGWMQEMDSDGCAIDEDGYSFRRRIRPRFIGEGPCPQCGAKTVQRKGRYGSFYGCVNFPKCRGSRDGRQPERNQLNG